MSLWEWQCVINGYIEAHTPQSKKQQLSDEEADALFELVKEG